VLERLTSLGDAVKLPPAVGGYPHTQDNARMSSNSDCTDYHFHFALPHLLVWRRGRRCRELDYGAPYF